MTQPIRPFPKKREIEEVKQILFVLLKNGMFPVNENNSKGKSIDEPIIIDLADGYVSMEYLVAGFLLHPKQHKFKMQSIFHKDGRYYDQLLYEVIEEDGTIHEEHYFFDITVGFKANSGR